VRILITASQFGLGGTETYSVTVAEQLERLGHPTRLFAGHATAEGRELAAERGLRLTVGDPAALADLDDVDAAIVQDAASAYALARSECLRQVFVVHGVASFEHPPQAPAPPPPAVVLNERIRTRLGALGTPPEIVRLRQPIDIERFRPRGASRPRARRVLVFSNYLGADRLGIVEAACEGLGLELVRLGVGAGASVSPQQAIAEADIVVGYGRSVLEAMAMGRAAYVWERGGGDGWVTPESYADLEADGFSGGATDAVIDAARLSADFASYRPEMGTLAFDLVRKHHKATRHVEALLGLLERARAPASKGPLEELALLVRAEARAANRAAQFEHQLGLRVEELERRGGEAEALRAAVAAEREGRLSAQRQLEAVASSSSWRLTAPLRWASSRLRRGSPGLPDDG
jgi:hypothetical protein